MKLRCKSHNQRVWVFRGEGDEIVTRHRDDSKRCKSLKLVIGGQEYTPGQIVGEPEYRDGIAYTSPK